MTCERDKHAMRAKVVERVFRVRLRALSLLSKAPGLSSRSAIHVTSSPMIFLLP